MKTDELKLRIDKFVYDTLDLYMPPTNFIDKLKNSTAKLWYDQNKWKMNKALEAFSDENHEIDMEDVIRHYEDALFENGEMRLDVKTVLPVQYEWLKDYLPNKIILFKKDDLKNIFK